MKGLFGRMDPNYKLPKSVIEFYKPYENKSKHIKIYKVMSTRFEMDDYYEIIDSSKLLQKLLRNSNWKTVGQGAYGLVVAARNKISNELVAVKKIEKAYDHRIFAKRTLRELRCQRLLKHDNVNQPKPTTSEGIFSREDFRSQNHSIAKFTGEVRPHVDQNSCFSL